MHSTTIQNALEAIRHAFGTPFTSQHLISILLIAILYLMGGTAKRRKTQDSQQVQDFHLVNGVIIWTLTLGSCALLVSTAIVCDCLNIPWKKYTPVQSQSEQHSDTPQQTGSKSQSSAQTSITEPTINSVQQGDLKHHGGTPTIRKTFVPPVDNPSTTNDESNDQPIGHFGKATINVYNVSSGNSYPLDADIEDGQVKRLYFEKGGWVDFDGAEIDADGNGEGTDETGHEWRFEGFAS